MMAGLVRFHPRFLAFAKEYGFFLRACNRAAGWEKGKVERGGIGYTRQNFWPLRQFSDLYDLNRQVHQWLQEVANQRLHLRLASGLSIAFSPVLCVRFRRSLRIIGIAWKCWFIRISGCTSTATATVCRHI